ncbi:amidohydrolase family protein [Tunicatimonas pelagia]|uniref:amidohydrolase family protein n=1 Tax=Tunicatimonas pelagia TaxID=931531 RepID=UPI0026670AD8|nr:amidohydrolase family protein [Tunicatimonas pelagia]WKN42124.1 amidohydrolase family protein [Tunicatimonas pelagia]
MSRRREFLRKSLSVGMGLAVAPQLAKARSSTLKDISIVDTHVHFWELDRLEYPWLESNESSLSQDFLLADYQQATQGYQVNKIVFVESGRVPWQYLEEVKWVHQLAKQHDLIGSMVAYFPVDQGESARTELEELAAYPLVQGVRSMGNTQEQLASAQYRDGLRLLSELDLSLDVHIGTTDFDDYLTLIDQYPNLRFVLNHLGLPNVKNGELNTWRSGIQRLAERPNVVCKLSGLLTRCHPEQVDNDFLKPYILAPLEYFGTKRIMFGSDWPVLTRANTFNVWAQLLEGLTNELSQPELTQIFSQTAREVYRID